MEAERSAGAGSSRRGRSFLGRSSFFFVHFAAATTVAAVASTMAIAVATTAAVATMATTMATSVAALEQTTMATAMATTVAALEQTTVAAVAITRATMAGAGATITSVATMAAVATMTGEHFAFTTQQGDADHREKDRDAKNQCAIHS